MPVAEVPPAEPGALLHSHLSSRAGVRLLQGLFAICVVMGVQYLVRSSRDHASAAILTVLGLGGVLVVRWLASLRPREVRAHENGLALVHDGLLPGVGAKKAFVPYRAVRTVRRDEDMDGALAYLFELEGHAPLRLSPLRQDEASLQAIASTVATRAGLSWEGPLARRAGPASTS